LVKNNFFKKIRYGGFFVEKRRCRSYTPAIFHKTPEAEAIVKNVLQKLLVSETYKSMTMIASLPFTNFYFAEECHQDFAKINPARYAFYCFGSGRM